jgi:hypothetical protein
MMMGEESLHLPVLSRRLKTAKLIGNSKSLPNLQEPGM